MACYGSALPLPFTPIYAWVYQVAPYPQVSHFILFITYFIEVIFINSRIYIYNFNNTDIYEL